MEGDKRRTDPSAHRLPQVEILLATYNGERYLHQQIDSLLRQDGVEVSVLARDDGSQDTTRSILEDAARTHPAKFRLMTADASTGSAKRNFARLLAASSAPYVALADQDDVWAPDKLQFSMDAMEALERQHGSSTPLLVFTDLTVVDPNLNVLHPSLWKYQDIDAERIRNLPRLLAQNVVTGNTALLNRALVQRVLPIPEAAFMHDWWIALLACAFGYATPLHRSTVLYRQHESNAVGAVPQHRRRLIPGFRNHARRQEQWEMIAHQAIGFLDLHGDALPSAKRRVLEAYRLCQTSPSRLVRVFTYLRYGLFLKGLRRNLALLWYLWDRDTAMREPVVNTETAP